MPNTKDLAQLAIRLVKAVEDEAALHNFSSDEQAAALRMAGTIVEETRSAQTSSELRELFRSAASMRLGAKR